MNKMKSMKIIDQYHEFVQMPKDVLKTIESIGRTCYKSEDKITETSAKDFVKMIMRSGHESVIEHISASVRFVTDRAVTHELVRHRLCSFSQESQRYVRYNDIEFIRPVWWNDEGVELAYWINSCKYAEQCYKSMLANGAKPEQARSVLPNSVKTEIVVTANLREWRHIFKLRTSKRAYGQIRSLMLNCLSDFKKEISVIFDDIR